MKFTATAPDWYFGDVASTGVAWTKAKGVLFEVNEGETYKITLSNTNIIKNYMTSYDKNKISLGFELICYQSNSFTYIVPTGVKYISLRIGMGESVTVVGTTYETTIQIEKSPTASETYIPHAEQNAPLTLGNIEAYEGDEIEIDYVQKAGYKKVTGANLVQNWLKYDFTGEETFTKSPSINNVVFYTAMFSPQIKVADSNNYVVLMYSNCFISYSANKIFGQDVVGVSAVKNKNVQFGLGINSEITTVEAFQQMLAQKNVSLVYPLETPVITPITDPTLLAQLEALINLKTYKTITNINCTGEDLAPVLDCDYYQDMSTVKSDIASIKARLDLLEE